MKLRRVLTLTGAALLLVGPAYANPVDTTVRTMVDQNGDNAMDWGPGEDHTVMAPTGFDETFDPPANGSLLNFLQMSDFQMVDEESPARVEFIDGTQRAPGLQPFSAAYRPMESLTTQVAEAMVRQARNTRSPVTGRPLDLTILTGDNADNQQYNETRWFIDILDGTTGTGEAETAEFDVQGQAVELPVGPSDRIDPNSGIPVPGCEATPGSVYDGVRGSGVRGAPDDGYYEPDSSTDDGDGYTPDRNENRTFTGADVTLRDYPGLFEAANSPFEAVGLGMPWFSAFGNHDALVQGNSPEAFVGPFGAGGEAANPVFHGIATGCTKPMEPSPTGLEDPEHWFSNTQNAQVVPPDPRRCFLAKDGTSSGAPAPCDDTSFIGEHFKTTGTPVGHGFLTDAQLAEMYPQYDCAGCGRPLRAVANHDGYYSFSPRAGLRWIVLDTVTDECGSPFCSEGSVDDAQFQWLDQQLAQAQDNGEYAMVFSHHTLKTIRWPSTDPSEAPVHYGQRIDRDNPANPQNPASPETLEELFCRYDNMLAHITGHEHANYVRHYTCEQDSPPVTLPRATHDFWFISTAAHVDWPQQSRIIELIDNGERGRIEGETTMSLVLTMLDHAGDLDPCGGPGTRTSCAPFAPGGQYVTRLAGVARELAYNDPQGGRASRGDPEDRNLLIVIDRPWPYASDGSG